MPFLVSRFNEWRHHKRSRVALVYGFPFTDNVIWGPGFMFYNKSLFQQAGLDPAQPPTTWNQFTVACQAIKAKTRKYCLAISLKGSDFQRNFYFRVYRLNSLYSSCFVAKKLRKML